MPFYLFFPPCNIQKKGMLGKRIFEELFRLKFAKAVISPPKKHLVISSGLKAEPYILRDGS